MKLIDKRTPEEIEAARLDPIPDLRARYEGTNVTYSLPRCDEHKRGAVCRRKGDHEVNSPIRDTHWTGLRRDKDGAFRFKAYPKARFTPGQIPDRTRENVAACAALGLSFWSDHYAPNKLWAVDDDQRAHQVEVNRKTHRVYHACYETDRYDPDTQNRRDVKQCKDASNYVYSADWEVGESMPMISIEDANTEVAAAVAASREEHDMPTPTPVSDKTSKARHDAKMKRGKELIRSSGGRVTRAKTAKQTVADSIKARELKAAADEINSKAIREALNRAIEPKPMSRGVARSILLHDPEHLDSIPNDALVDLLEVPELRKHHANIRRELKNNRGLTPARKGKTT